MPWRRANRWGNNPWPDGKSSGYLCGKYDKMVLGYGWILPFQMCILCSSIHLSFDVIMWHYVTLCDMMWDVFSRLDVTYIVVIWYIIDICDRSCFSRLDVTVALWYGCIQDSGSQVVGIKWHSLKLEGANQEDPGRVWTKKIQKWGRPWKTWFYMILYDFVWFYMILYDFIWFYMNLYDFIWFYMILWQFSWGR